MSNMSMSFLSVWSKITRPSEVFCAFLHHAAFQFIISSRTGRQGTSVSNLEAKICPHESTKGRKEGSGCFSELSKTSDLLQSSHRVMHKAIWARSTEQGCSWCGPWTATSNITGNLLEVLIHCFQLFAKRIPMIFLLSVFILSSHFNCFVQAKRMLAYKLLLEIKFVANSCKLFFYFLNLYYCLIMAKPEGLTSLHPAYHLAPSLTVG